jgi:hypothetical protein
MLGSGMLLRVGTRELRRFLQDVVDDVRIQVRVLRHQYHVGTSLPQSWLRAGEVETMKGKCPLELLR